MSRKAVLGLLALVAGAASLTLLPRNSRDPGASSEGRPRPAPTPGTPEPSPGPAPAVTPGKAPGECGIRGVVHRDGKPVAARIEACRLFGGPPDPAAPDAWTSREEGLRLGTGGGPTILGQTKAGADGLWTLDGLPQGEWLFEATAPDGSKGFAETRLIPAGSGRESPTGHSLLEIEVGKVACALHGRARLPGGEPFRGFVMVTRDSRLVSLPVEAGPEGEFRFPSVPRACVRLVACEPGRRVVPGPFVLLPCEEEVPFVVGCGLVEARGRVVEASGDRGVFGAKVSVSFADGSAGAAADPEGRFRLSIAERDYLRIRAEAPGFLPAREENVGGIKEGSRPIELRLHRPATLSGAVTLAGTGAPAVGAVVVLLDQEGGFRTGGSRATTGPDGRYEIRGLRPGRSIVLVAGGGFSSKSIAGPDPWDPDADGVELPEGGTATRDLVAVAAPRVSGRVVDAGGSGVGGVAVAVSPWTRFDGVMRFQDAASHEEFESGADGGFLVPSILPGVSYEFLASRKGDVCAVSSLPPVPAGGEGEVLLRIAPECRVDVRVLEEGSEKPIPGARIQVMAEFLPGSGMSWGVGGGWRTGEDGSVSIGPLPGVPLQFSVMDGDSRPGGSEVRIGPPVTAPVVLHGKAGSAAPTVAVSGRILLPDGTPAANVEWWCWPEGNPMGFSPRGNADYRGRFRVEGLGEGKVSISASLPGNPRASQVEAQAGDEDVVLRLGASAAEGEPARTSLQVSVLDAERRPVRGGKVNLFFPDAEEDSPISEQYSDRDLVRGAATVEFPPGATTVWLQVEGASSADAEPRPLADGLFGPLGAEAGGFDAVLAPAKVIEGRVVDPEGKAVAGAAVGLCPRYPNAPEKGGFLGDRLQAATTDAGGHFRIEGVGDRQYGLFAFAGDFHGSEDTSARGGETGVVLVMKKAASAMVTVLDPEGKPVAGASVDLETPGLHFSGRDIPTTNGAGKVLLRNLRPDEPGDSKGYVLDVSPPQDRSGLLRVKIRDWVPADTIVRLPGAHTLAVRVQDLKGGPFPGVFVAARFGDYKVDPNQVSYGTTDADGMVTLQRIPAGSVDLSARLDGSFSGAGPTLERKIDGESGKVVLTLDPGAEIRVRVPGARAGNHVLVHVGEPGQLRTRIQADGDGGEARIRGLEAGVAYDLFIEEYPKSNFGGSAGGACRSAILRGVNPRGDPVEVVLSPGKAISGVVHLPKGWHLLHAGIGVGDAILIGCDTSDYKGGTFHIGDVPEGRWTVRVLIGTEAGAERILDAEAEAGGRVELDAR